MLSISMLLLRLQHQYILCFLLTTLLLLVLLDYENSHIRTLLLTFFYRQMKHLAENGHLYIAQPPLFKVKRCKDEIYLKDETALEDYVFDTAQDGVSVSSKLKKTAIAGKNLLAMLKRISRFRRSLARMEKRGRDAEIIGAISFMDDLGPETLKSQKDVNTLIDGIKAHLSANSGGKQVEFSSVEDPEHGTFSITCTSRHNGSTVETVLDRDFLGSSEFSDIKTIARGLKEAGEPPFILKSGENETEITSYDGVIDYILESGKKGLTIQR